MVSERMKPFSKSVWMTPAACGAFGFGYVQDRIGHVRAIALTLCGWMLMIAARSARADPTLTR